MIERTVLEIAQLRFWAWQRRHRPTPRSQLRETDQLLGAIEECRVHELKLIPTDIWRRIVHLLGQLDGDYTERLGIDRSLDGTADRKSTRLNSSHSQISYAVFCLKKKKH